MLGCDRGVQLRAMIRIILVRGLLVALLALLAPMSLLAQEGRPHSVLVLDQSDLRGPFYHELSAGLRGGGGGAAFHFTLPLAA